MTAKSPIFTIEKQESLAQDEFLANGVTKQLHIVAKAIPFTIHVASPFHLGRSAMHATLVYDDEDSIEREVETVKSAPLEYVAHISKDGYKAAVEVKLHVLSSQHEGSFFRIKFSLVESSANELHEILSYPIKVISKRNQVKKIIEKKEATMASVNAEPNNNKKRKETSSSSETSAAASPQKRTATDLIAETLLRLEQQQREQAQILQQVAQQQQQYQQLLLASTEQQQQPSTSSRPNKRSRTDTSSSSSSNNTEDFDTIFRTFVQAYSRIPVAERTQRVMKAVLNSTDDERVHLGEFVGAFQDNNTPMADNQDGELLMMNNEVADSNNNNNNNLMMTKHSNNSYLDSSSQALDDLYSDLLSSPISASSDVETY